MPGHGLCKGLVKGCIVLANARRAINISWGAMCICDVFQRVPINAKLIIYIGKAVCHFYFCPKGGRLNLG